MGVSKGTELETCRVFKMPMQEAIFLEICSICTFQVKFSSIFTPRDLVNSACFIELLSIVIDGSI